MAILHYGTAEIRLTADEVKLFTRDTAYDAPGIVSFQLAGGWIHLVVGPGIPIWIDERVP
jgi:hypothetical protein